MLAARIRIACTRLSFCSSQQLSRPQMIPYNKFSTITDFVSKLSSSISNNATSSTPKQKIDCSQPTSIDEDNLEDLEEMFVMGPAGMEWNGPTRGGSRPEPTRYGDWERKGRASDF